MTVEKGFALQRSSPDAIGIALVIGLGITLAFTERLAFAVIGLCVLGALLFIHPKYPVYVLALSLGVNVTIASTPAHVSIPQLFGLSIVGAALLRRILLEQNREKTGKLWAWSGILFTISTLPSFVASVAPTNSLLATAQLVFIGVLIYATVRLFRPGTISIEHTCMFLLLGATISAIPAFIQSILELGPQSFVRGGLMRAYSTFGQPNSYGQYLAGIVPLSLGLLLQRRTYGVFFAIAAVALLLTGSRGAIAATLLAVLAMVLLLQLRSRSQAILGMSVSVGVAAAAFALLPRAFFGSVLTLGDWSVGQRALALLTTWRGITSRPVLGFGAGSFKAVVSDIRVAGLVDDIEIPHNMVLDIWFEVGLLAVLCFFALLFLYYRAVVRAYRRSGDGVLLALLGAFTGLIAASMFGTLVVRGISELLALVIGMTAGRLGWLERGSRPADSQRRTVSPGSSVSGAIVPPT